MRVYEVMSTGLVTAYRTDTVRSAVVKMMNRQCGAIPVVEGDARLVGMVTLRDVLLPLYPNYGDYIHDSVHSRDFVEMEEGYPDVLSGKIEAVMSPNPLTVARSDPILEADSYMGLKNFRRMPVVDKGRIEEGGFAHIGQPDDSAFHTHDASFSVLAMVQGRVRCASRPGGKERESGILRVQRRPGPLLPGR